MESGLVELAARVCATATSFDAAGMDRLTAVRSVEAWTKIANAANAACALAAARVAECGAPPEAGASSAAEWLGKTTGTSTARATERIRNGKTLQERPRTRAQATAGGLSVDQTAAVAHAVAANPAAEEKLLGVAARGSLSELREECARATAAADPDPEATERRIHARRCLRRYRDSEGAEHLHATGTKRDMAKVDTALRALIDERFNQARTDGEREPFEAYGFDALVALAERNGPTKMKPRYLAVLRADLEALTRGNLGEGETCEIAGLGPIPVATAREVLGESILELVITKATDVINVTHLGRGPNAVQKIALLWQQPVCTREGCGKRSRLQYDHRDPWARVLCTELGNIDPLCTADHHRKTHQGWALIEGTGTRPMVPPHHPDHPLTRAGPNANGSVA